MKNHIKTYLIKVGGIVQGVGFRPFISSLAEKFHFTGEVFNSGGIVTIIINSDEITISKFVYDIKKNCPFGGEISQIITKEIEEKIYEDFRITPSEIQKSDVNLIPIDFPLCQKCKEELYDKSDRRYKYPFISCVSCGPRYTIIKELPYDRENTTMANFSMCQACKNDYSTKTRRKQAQTISCHNCGPQLLLNINGKEINGKIAFKKAVEILKNNGILAVKSVGGYNFVCNPYSKIAVNNLRILKARDAKPFAVMFNSIDEIETICEVSTSERELLQSVARPIVLLKKRKDDNFCYEVSGESTNLGAFLSNAPLQDLLINEIGVLVFTSANISSEPIIFKDEKMLSLKSEFLDGVLYNKREIFVPLDDSVSRIILEKPQVIRRARGYVPNPISIVNSSNAEFFCTGGDLKASFGLMKNDKLFLSQYFGDLENADVFETYKSNFEHMISIFNINPKYVVTDFHPQYFSTKFANGLNINKIEVQHHHAHIASVMAENEISREVIGFAFDGTGYGDDGCIWGGEVLICDNISYNRVGHLKYTKMCGGDKLSKDASMSAFCYLNSLNIDNNYLDAKFNIVKSALENDINTHFSSSFGRLFDAVAFLTEIKESNSYEGECAISLENYAEYAIKNSIPPIDLSFEIIEENDTIIFDYEKLINSILSIEKSKKNKFALALGFHYAIINIVVKISLKLREEKKINKVALSGGVFQNKILVTECVKGLESEGFEAYINRKVPTNDGGIALGQAFVASNILKRNDK